jgi:hypothetical protein
MTDDGDHFRFRREAIRQLTNQIGVYVLCDLDRVPIYVGQSKDGIRARVRRHLTSARSDIIANRQIDVWEIAYVWAFPVDDKSDLDVLEARLFHCFDPVSRLMNGALPPRAEPVLDPRPDQEIQVLSDEHISERRDFNSRLPRQAKHYADIVDHFLNVKESKQIARAMDAHFERLMRYHRQMLDIDVPED